MNSLNSTDSLRIIKSLSGLFKEGLSDQETIVYRNSKCQSCEHLDKDNSSQKCKLCGCYVWAKMRISAAECPDNPSRWQQ